jgi:hypothetical protein
VNDFEILDNVFGRVYKEACGHHIPIAYAVHALETLCTSLALPLAHKPPYLHYLGCRRTLL